MPSRKIPAFFWALAVKDGAARDVIDDTAGDIPARLMLGAFALSDHRARRFLEGSETHTKPS